MEETKFWTKAKIIFLCIILLFIIIIISSFFIHKSIMKDKYIKFENQLTYAAPNYLLKEKIVLAKGEWRKINIKKILEQKLVVNSVSSDCTGYVIAEANSKTSTVNYKTYITCGNIYRTSENGNILNKKDENKTKTQSENDTEKPIIKLLGKSSVTVKLGGKYKESGAVATDNVDGDITSKIKITGKVDTSLEGEYKVKYSVADKAGNKATKTRKIIVKKSATTTTKDTTKPVITFTNNIVQTICTGTKIDISATGPYGYVAYDDTDGDITNKVTITGDVGEIGQVGTFKLKYSVTDKAKNKYTITREFNTKSCVVENPVVTTPTPAPAPTPTPSPSPTPSNPSSSSSSSGSSSSSSSSSSSGGGSQVTPPSTNTTVNVTSVVLTPNSITLSRGGSSGISVSVYPSNATNKSVSFSSSNPSVVSVDGSGRVTGLNSGSARITATSSNGISGSCSVRVN